MASFIRQEIYERHVNSKTYDKSFSDIEQLAKITPKFPILSVRSREAVQFASEIIKKLEDAGFDIVKITPKSSYFFPDMPEVLDTPTAVSPGVIVFCKDNYEARRGATSLQKALSDIGVKSTTSTKIPDDSEFGLMVIVGDKP